MTTKRQLRFLFQQPGMIEAVAKEPSRPRTGKSVLSQGYGDSSIPDLLMDYRLDADRPFAWISYSFDKTYPIIIWSLKLLMADERFDLPQAGLKAVPLHEAFSWAYTHFILEDEVPVAPPEKPYKSPSLAGQVLRYAAAAV